MLVESFATRQEISKSIEELVTNKCLAADIAHRKYQLSQLLKLLDDNKDDIITALKLDFKSHYEARCEHSLVVSEVVYALNNMDSWMKEERPSVDLAFKFDGCRVRYLPMGLVLVIGAWNYPLALIIQPLVGAIAAGNCVLVKPSEVALNTAKLVTELMNKYLNKKTIRILMTESVEDAAWLVEQGKWDAVLYTGSTKVGNIIATTVTKQQPCKVILECGGKCPTLVLPDANIDTTVNRIIWGKFLNAGQTCIAPDYVLLIGDIDRDVFVEKCLKTIKRMYGEDPSKSPDYARIINQRQKDRLIGLMKNANSLVVGTSPDLFLAPTILVDPPKDHPSMKEEIFGPLLPIISVKSLEEAVKFVKAGEKPLALYAFAGSKGGKEIDETNFDAGSVVINDTLMHAFIPELPFGGVGASGVGAYHGKYTFLAFSHAQSGMWRSGGREWINERTRYPPLDENKVGWLEALMWSKPSKRHFGYRSNQ